MSSRVRVLLLIAPALFLGCFFLWPVGAIVDTGLRPGGRLDLSPILDVVTQRPTRHVIGFTVWQAALSTVETFAVALPGAWALGRVEFPGRRLVRAAVVLPFVLPTVVVAVAMKSLIGRRGVLSSVVELDDSLAAIVAAHVFFEYAIVARVVGGQWARLDRRVEDAARSLGASPSQVLRHVTLPLLRPALLSAATLVFLFTATSFGIVVLLGGPQHATLEVAIARAAAQAQLPAASALAVVQLVAVVAMLAVEARLRERRHGAPGFVAEPAAGRRRLPGRQRAGLVAVLASMLVLLGGPLAVLVERSLRVGDGYGLDWYRRLGTSDRASILFVSPWASIRTSLLYASIAAVLALVLGGAAAVALSARRDRLARSGDTLLALPLGTSAVTLGLGFLVALDTPPLDLRGSRWLVPIAHALIGVPFVVRVLMPALRSVDQRLREVAATLGATPWRVWREVDLALAWRAVLLAGGFAFAISLGEFGATTVIGRSDTPTVPIAIGRFLSQPGAGSFGQAAAMSVVLLVLTGAAVLLADRRRLDDAADL